MKSIFIPLIVFSFLFAVLPAQATEEISSAETPAYILEEITREMKQELIREREQAASEDPLSKLQSDKIDEPELHEALLDSFNVYGSLRYRIRETPQELVFGDGGTRIGMNASYQFIPHYRLLGRVEIGSKLFDHLDQILDPGAQGNGTFTDDIFLRLGYIGIEFPKAFLTYGKSWSTYYQVASFTDRFQGAGANASGTYNAGTDGGASGTGRANRALQTRIEIKHPWRRTAHLKPFNINLQYQAGEKIPYAEDTKFKYSFGASAILEHRDNFKSGIAFNYASIKKVDRPYLQSIGIDGNDISVLYGIQGFGEKWFASTVFSWLNNHMTSNDGIYFDAWGNEGYGHYQVFDRIWLTGGWNYLEPHSGEEQVGNYILRYAVIGLRYTFKDFQQMIYANIRLDKSRLESTSSGSFGTTYTIGIKWDFDW